MIKIVVDCRTHQRIVTIELLLRPGNILSLAEPFIHNIAKALQTQINNLKYHATYPEATNLFHIIQSLLML